MALYTEYAAVPKHHWEDQRPHTSLILGFCEAMKTEWRPRDRRSCLVLLQRAMRVVEDIRAAGAEPSKEVLQALATAAGRAGQVQQALQICHELQVRCCCTSMHLPFCLEGLQAGVSSTLG